MNNSIIKFKNDLKQFQASRKQHFQECDKEIILLDRLFKRDPSLHEELNKFNIPEKLPIFTKFHALHHTLETIQNILNKKLKKKNEKQLEDIEKIYEDFCIFTNITKQEHIITQNIINAFENDKIKEPINDMNLLLEQIKITSLSNEDISIIIGLAISFNSQYAKKNKNHNIINIEIIDKLEKYYNQDGTFKYNEDIKTFKILINLLFNTTKEEKNNNDDIFNISPNNLSISDIAELLKTSNERLKNNITNTTPIYEEEKKDDSSSIQENRESLQELRKYYKNGSIISIPENLEEFYIILENCNLDDKEKSYIIDLINKELIKQNNNTTQKILTEEEQTIFDKSINLLNSINNSHSDAYLLKHYIKELQTIFDLLSTETSKDDIQFLLSDIPHIIEQLSLICNKYEVETKESSNRFIFLQDKDNIPYLFNDIDLLSQNYKKAIYSLIPKINKFNQAQFRKILHPEKLPYNMYEVISPKAHVTFIEIDTGIYIIIGGNIARNGYKELINRLISNESNIKDIEEKIKIPKIKNDILLSNETYLQLLSEENNINLTRKLTKKINK